ncbi:hypothetical protein FB45DRAFT_1099043 [Roridomyces roridus]|uniref:AAA-ATPase-like domain-containing protein n=1 Tax=Roridomyces roridus TaxID=1738132 RepID=A0AAD7CE84_9AGAR|nr:hypothetical protein FB45DRAFT_1099043 [Roridomyces roridus]
MPALVDSSTNDELAEVRATPSDPCSPETPDHGSSRPPDDEFPKSTPHSDFKRRISDDLSGDESPRKRMKPFKSAESKTLRLPSSNQHFVEFYYDPRIVFVDKTRFLFQLPDRFRYLLLRPHGFGKTTFLSSMSQFYDIHGGDKFPEYFGTPENTRSNHRQHLCLCLKLWEIDRGVRYGVVCPLRSFLVKYKTELGLSESYHLDAQDHEPLKRVLDLVRSHGRTLFVGVDDHDAPLRKNLRSRPGSTDEDVAQLLDKYLWSPLQTGAEIIPKLFVTGTLSLQTPVLQDLVVPAPDQLYSCCGFTESEALRMAQKILPERMIDTSKLGAQCGGYYFACDSNISEPLVHPQIFINHLSSLLYPPRHWERDPTGGVPRLLSSLFDYLPLESVDANTVTTDGLIQFIASGAVMDVDELDSSRELDGTSVYWGTLCRAGALTHCGDSRSTLRVANRQVLSFIHSRIDKRVRELYDPHVHGSYRPDPTSDIQITWDFSDALFRYCSGRGDQNLIQILTQLLRDQTQRSFGKKREPTLKGVLELMLRNVDCMPYGSLRLLEPIVLEPSNVTRVRLYETRSYVNGAWNCLSTTLTLHGMWRGANPTPSNVEPSVDDLRELFEELCEEDKETLLARPYRERGATGTSPVESFFDPWSLCTQLITVGGVTILLRCGSDWDVYRDDLLGIEEHAPFADEDEEYFTALNDTGSVPEEALELSDCDPGPDFGPEQFTLEDEEWTTMIPGDMDSE